MERGGAKVSKEPKGGSRTRTAVFISVGDIENGGERWRYIDRYIDRIIFFD